MSASSDPPAACGHEFESPDGCPTCERLRKGSSAAKRQEYATIVADPPWPMAWSAGPSHGSSQSWSKGERGRTKRTTLGYDTMSIEQIAALPVAECGSPDCNLFLWIPDRFLIAGDGRLVAEAWGFKPGRVLLFWAKRGLGLGRFPLPQHEALVVCSRGKSTWTRTGVGSVHEWPNVYGKAGRSVAKINSAKPDAALDLIESVSPGPYLELFARRQRLGWDTWGNEALEHVEIAS